jgi:hypothetical protein
MAIYFGTTEITKLRDLAPQSGLDITDLWFGSTNIYTVWQTYEGTLPATLNANGDDMRQYQIYGATGGVGDKTENLFEVESNMLSSLNWGENPKLNNIVYFINYKLSNAVTQELKKGIHTCSIFKHFTDGYTPNLLVCAFTPTLDKTINETYRILTNQGVTFAITFDFSEWQDIYLVIGYGNGFRTNAEKQLKIDELFTNWRISIVEGTTAPASFVPFGYEVDMVSRTRNQLPSAAEQTITLNGVTATCDGKGKYSFTGTASAPVTITFTLPYDYTIPKSKGGGGNGTFSMFNTKGYGAATNNKRIELLYNDTIVDSWNFTIVNRNATSYSAMVGKSINALRFYFVAGTDTNFSCSPMFTNDSTGLPNVYEPYDYKVTTIYIGNDPLDKDEYADYQSQKVYRMIDGTLTPTDPPVTLPALPTCEGETVIDYAGESVAPEKVLLKYRKEGF